MQGRTGFSGPTAPLPAGGALDGKWLLLVPARYPVLDKVQHAGEVGRSGQASGSNARYPLMAQLAQAFSDDVATAVGWSCGHWAQWRPWSVVSWSI